MFLSLLAQAAFAADLPGAPFGVPERVAVAPAAAEAPDTLRLNGGVGFWSGDSVRIVGVAAGGNVGWEHRGHLLEVGHDRVAELLNLDEGAIHRTTVLYGRRKEGTYGPAHVALEGSVGIGFGPDRTSLTDTTTAFGAVAQARVSLGTRHVGVQSRVLGMVGTAPFDVAVSVGLYGAFPLD